LTALAIEVNDAGLTVADRSGVLAVEPGYALVEAGRIVTGHEALRQARLKPRRVTNRFWSGLSAEPGSAGLETPATAAQLAYAQLGELWRRYAEAYDDVVLVVPGHYRAEQLGLLLGLAQECGMPVSAFVDVAAAASARPYPGHQLVYVDATLHRVTATALAQGSEVTVRAEQSLTQSGLAAFRDLLARRIAEMFVLATRFDPFHHAETEQLLYDRLDERLRELGLSDQAEFSLPFDGEEFRVKVDREQLLGVASGFYRALVQLIAQHRAAGESMVVQLSARLASLPGLDAELTRLDDAHIEPLPAGYAAQAALEADFGAGSGTEVKLWKHLPWRGEEVRVAIARRSASAAAETPQHATPTHVAYRGIVYPVGHEGLLVGRETENGRRALIVDAEHSGVSRVHCELSMRNGELMLRDLSRYGTFVNEKRISGETVLHCADVIRIGSPGAELQAVMLETGHGT
jgi:FHA domain